MNCRRAFLALLPLPALILAAAQPGNDLEGTLVSFLIDGKQHVAIAAGQALFVFGLP